MKIIQIRLPFSNAYLIKDRQAILVDTGSPGQADRILAAAERAGIQPGDITLILHTHGHFDHAGSTAELQRRLKVPSAVHASDAFMLRQGVNGEIKPINLEARLLQLVLPTSFEPSQPDLLIEEEFTLTDYGVNGKVCFTPGHTQGSLSILLENREALIGDVLMGGMLGGALFGTRPNYHYFINDRQALHASLRKILAWGPTTLYVGHGGPLQAAEVVRKFENVTRA